MGVPLNHQCSYRIFHEINQPFWPSFVAAQGTFPQWSAAFHPSCLGTSPWARAVFNRFFFLVKAWPWIIWIPKHLKQKWNYGITICRLVYWGKCAGYAHVWTEKNWNTHAVFRFPTRFSPNKLSNDLVHTLMRWNEVEISLETRLDNDRFRIVQGVGEVCL